MKNVSDIKKEEGLNFVLPNEFLLGQTAEYMNRCAVFVHLYYIEDLGYYLSFLNNIPTDIDVYITYSDEALKKKVCEITNKKLKFIKKDNRGRDISSLLVACREQMLNYEIVCFIHDKKEKADYLKEKNSEWIKSQWNNMLSSEIYIKNVIYTLQTNANLGMLVPPAAIGSRIHHFYANTWMQNYENTIQLAKDLGVSADIDKSKSPITLGTVFWAKTVALQKLLKRQWKYTDFDEEPRANDGTLSHAIERVLAFVAQDAGFQTGWVMNDGFTSDYIEALRDSLCKSMGMLYDTYNIRYIYEIEKFNHEQNRLQEFCHRVRKIYIYGAGQNGLSCLKLLKSINVTPTAFVVSNHEGKNFNIQDIEVLDVRNVYFEKEDGVIVAVSYKYEAELIRYLETRNDISEENIIQFSQFKKF